MNCLYCNNIISIDNSTSYWLSCPTCPGSPKFIDWFDDRFIQWNDHGDTVLFTTSLNNVEWLIYYKPQQQIITIISIKMDFAIPEIITLVNNFKCETLILPSNFKNVLLKVLKLKAFL